jgi:hypothetical protein
MKCAAKEWLRVIMVDLTAMFASCQLLGFANRELTASQAGWSGIEPA